MIPGRAGTRTHDYRRQGTTDLFAAMNVATGEVLHDTRKAHTGRDVLAFVKWIDAHVDPDLELHVILDNLSARARPSAPGSNTASGAAGTCTSRRPRRRGST